MFNNFTEEIDIATCKYYKFNGFILLLILSISLSLNFLVLYAFIKFKELKYTYEFLIYALTILNIFATIIHLPIIIFNFLNCRLNRLF